MKDRSLVTVTRIPVCVRATDPILRAGLVAQLRPRPEVLVLPEDDRDHDAQVAVVGCDTITGEAVRILRSLRAGGTPRLVAVAAHIDDSGLLDAVEAGIVGLLRRRDCTPERMIALIADAAAGDGTLPADLLARLLAHVAQLRGTVPAPARLALAGLTEREITVVRLAAEGLDNQQIAGRLHYSERTVKAVLHGVTTRLGLRNRTHAVAYALRHGLI